MRNRVSRGMGFGLAFRQTGAAKVFDEYGLGRLICRKCIEPASIPHASAALENEEDELRDTINV